SAGSDGRRGRAHDGLGRNQRCRREDDAGRVLRPQPDLGCVAGAARAVLALISPTRPFSAAGECRGGPARSSGGAALVCWHSPASSAKVAPTLPEEVVLRSLAAAILVLGLLIPAKSIADTAPAPRDPNFPAGEENAKDALNSTPRHGELIDVPIAAA